MLRGGIPIGRLFGTSIRLHYSWFFVFALITWASAANYFPAAYPAWSLSTKIGAGLITSFLFFGGIWLIFSGNFFNGGLAGPYRLVLRKCRSWRY